MTVPNWFRLTSRCLISLDSGVPYEIIVGGHTKRTLSLYSLVFPSIYLRPKPVKSTGSQMQYRQSLDRYGQGRVTDWFRLRGLM